MEIRSVHEINLQLTYLYLMSIVIKVVDSFVFWFDFDSMTSQRDPPQKIPLTHVSTTNQIVARFSWFCKQKHSCQVELFWRWPFCDVIESKTNQNTNASVTLKFIDWKGMRLEVWKSTNFDTLSESPIVLTCYQEKNSGRLQTTSVRKFESIKCIGHSNSLPRYFAFRGTLQRVKCKS